MTMPTTRPNFFLLLELNPNEEWDQAVYEKRLQEKCRQWNRESNGIAKKALAAQANRALLPLIHSVMEDSTLRQLEADEARKLLARRYSAANERFERQLTLLNLKEHVAQEEIALFIKEFEDIASAEVIQKRITVKVRPAEAYVTHEPQPLDTSIVKNIVDRLEIVRKKTLYDVLQCSPESKTIDVFHAAEELYAKEVRQYPTAEITARVELAGFAMNLFKTDEMRARYDETLRQASLLQLLQDLEESLLRSSNKEVHPRQVLYYLKEAHQIGWKKQEAIEKLKEYGRTRRWSIVIPLVIEAENMYGVSNVDNYNNVISLANTNNIVENVYDVQYQMMHSCVRFYWKWPSNCQGIYISYSPKTGMIQHHVSPSTTLYVSRPEYERLGYYEISGIRNQHYSVLISSIIDQGDVQVVASGIYIHLYLCETILTYEIRLSCFPFRKRMLYIVSNTPGPIPSLLVISKLQDLPLKRTDGSYFDRIEEGKTDKKGEIRVRLSNRSLPAQTFGRIFLEDERLYNAITIRHPEREKLRLS